MMLSRPEPEQEQQLPLTDEEGYIAFCFTKGVGDGYSECLMNRPECVHARLFGYTTLCRHSCHRELRNPRNDSGLLPE